MLKFTSMAVWDREKSKSFLLKTTTQAQAKSEVDDTKTITSKAPTNSPKGGKIRLHQNTAQALKQS